MLMAWCLRPMASAPPWLTYTYLRHQEYPACNGLHRFHKLKCNSTLLNQLISIHMVMWFLSIHPATWVLFLLQSARLLCLLFYFVSVHTWFYMTIMENVGFKIVLFDVFLLILSSHQGTVHGKDCFSERRWIIVLFATDMYYPMLIKYLVPSVMRDTIWNVLA